MIFTNRKCLPRGATWQITMRYCQLIYCFSVWTKKRLLILFLSHDVFRVLCVNGLLIIFDWLIRSRFSICNSPYNFTVSINRYFREYVLSQNDTKCAWKSRNSDHRRYSIVQQSNNIINNIFNIYNNTDSIIDSIINCQVSIKITSGNFCFSNLRFFESYQTQVWIQYGSKTIKKK